MSNATCFDKQASQAGPSLFQNGNIVFQAHHVGWIICGFFTSVAVIASFWLVNKHLQWYTNKREQRYIVRLLFMVPIYAIISFASYLFWNHATPLLLIRDAYESTVLTAFFYLLLSYLSPDPDEQRAIFLKVGLSRSADDEAKRKGEAPRKWVFPLGFIKWKPEDGLYFLQLMKWGVLQYCVIRPTTTLAAVMLNYVGLYCESSWSPRWGHVYITVTVSLSVTIAMYCLIQLYVPISSYLAPKKPLLKLFAVKAVVFLTFWQATFLSILTMFGVVKDTRYMTADDINIGIGALLETFEMMLFAFLHIRAFTYKPYRESGSKGIPPMRTPRLRSLGHAMDFRETFREIWTGWLYIYDRMRGQEPRVDKGAKRVAHLEAALGRTRPSRGLDAGVVSGSTEKDVAGVQIEVERRMDVDGADGVERQWLGLGDGYGYGIGDHRREKSDDLEVQIERELQRRGLEPFSQTPADASAPEDVEPGYGHAVQRSWWRRMYNRISQTGPDLDHEDVSQSYGKKRKSRSKSRHHRRQQSRNVPLDVDFVQKEDPEPFQLKYDYDFDEPPPSSVLGTHTSRHSIVGFDPVGQEHRPIGITYAPRAPPSRNGPTTLDVPPRLARADSLLARVFPSSSGAESSTEQGHVTDSAYSMPSVSRDGCTPSQATPRARLTLSTPLIVAQGEPPSAGVRAPRAKHVANPPRPTTSNFPPNVLPPISAEVLDVSNKVSHRPDDFVLRPSHRREFAHHRDVRLDVALDTQARPAKSSRGVNSSRPVVEAGSSCTAPLAASPVFIAPYDAPSSSMISPHSIPLHSPIPEPPRLRRSPAHRYSGDGAYSRQPPNSSHAQREGVPSPTRTYDRHLSNNAGPSHRRMSEPLGSIRQDFTPSPILSSSQYPIPSSALYPYSSRNRADGETQRVPAAYSRSADVSNRPSLPSSSRKTRHLAHSVDVQRRPEANDNRLYSSQQTVSKTA